MTTNELDALRQAAGLARNAKNLPGSKYGAWVVVCGKCLTAKRHVGSLTNVSKKLRRAGWVFERNEWRCPACASKRTELAPPASA